jgi:hypothetical protein
LQPIGNLLSDQGGVASGAVVDDEIDLDLVLLGLAHDLCRVFDHFRIQHAADHFVKREGFGVGFFVARPEAEGVPGTPYLFLIYRDMVDANGALDLGDVPEIMKALGRHEPREDRRGRSQHLTRIISDALSVLIVETP